MPPWCMMICLLGLLGSCFAAGAAGVVVGISKGPPLLSKVSTAEFLFHVRGCSECSVTCKLDSESPPLNCSSGSVQYTGLQEGNHTFMVCANQRGESPSCAIYSWVADTVAPTAYVRAASAFTNASAVRVRISFSEPCTGGGGFKCSNSDCNLLVYGEGKVLPHTLEVIQAGMEYSIEVAIYNSSQYGRIVLAMQKDFCSDAAGNRFTRTRNSTFTFHFDKRDVTVNITSHITQKLLQINGLTRRIEATNNDKDLKIYLTFSVPVLNTSAEILNLVHTTDGAIVPTNRRTLGNRRFGYIVKNITSVAVATVTCDTSSIISRQGTPVNPSDPFTFLYDVQRPMVKVTISHERTDEQNIHVLIKFTKPVFNFSSSAIMVSGGYVLRFYEVSRQLYITHIQAVDNIISVAVAENMTEDVAGNKNLASNRLQVTPYSGASLSSAASIVVNIIFVLTATVAMLLTLSTSSLLSSGAFTKPVSHIISEPTRNLVRLTCHIQVFALSRWLTADLPIEYYDFLKGIQWTIPYHQLPWEAPDSDNLSTYSVLPPYTFSKAHYNSMSDLVIPSQKSQMKIPTEGDPLTPNEYWSFFEDMRPEAEIIMKLENLNGWKYFGRNMFWLAIAVGTFILLHGMILMIFRLQRKEMGRRNIGALMFPRFEIMLIVLALPCLCQAFTALIKGKTTTGMIAGIGIMIVVASLLLVLLLFLSLGITTGKLLQYREVHQEGQEYHWYEEIVRRTLGPGKRGQWIWKEQLHTACLTKLGPLFEDLRGPPKYMLSQIVPGRSKGRRAEQIIVSEDENEDNEAPFIQKVFGILRIYYTFIEAVKRVTLGTVAGALSLRNKSSRNLIVVVLAISCFQLFFIMLKKPFIKKKVQLVEIITVASETVIFSICLALVDMDFSEAGMRRIGLFMLAVFLFAFVAQTINEWYALYRQILRLSVASESFTQGLKVACKGLLWIVVPAAPSGDTDEQAANHSSNGDSGGMAAAAASNGQAHRNSDTDKPWLRQLREMAKASFSKEDAPGDPSSSRGYRIWGSKRSRSSSVTSSTDYKAKTEQKAKSKGLYKDLEDIFSNR